MNLCVFFSFFLLTGVTSSTCPSNPIPTCPVEDCRHWTELEFLIFYNCSAEVVQHLDQLEPWNPRSPVNYRLGLEIASEAGHIEIVAAILQRREKLGIELHGCEIASWLAAENNHRDVLELLLEGGSGTEECSEPWTNTPGGRRPLEQRAPSLLFAAAKGGSVESLRLLIDSGANLDAWGGRCHGFSGICGTALEESMRRYQSPPQVATCYSSATITFTGFNRNDHDNHFLRCP